MKRLRDPKTNNIGPRLRGHYRRAGGLHRRNNFSVNGDLSFESLFVRFSIQPLRRAKSHRHFNIRLVVERRSNDRNVRRVFEVCFIMSMVAASAASGSETFFLVHVLLETPIRILTRRIACIRRSACRANRPPGGPCRTSTRCELRSRCLEASL